MASSTNKQQEQHPSKQPSTEEAIIQQQVGNNIHTSFENLMEVYNILNDGTTPPSSDTTTPLNLSERKKGTTTALKGREVMIPVTKQAFFHGSLQPRMIPPKKEKNAKSTSSEKNEAVEKEEESVMLNLGQNYYAEVSKSEACHILAQRMEKIILSTESTENDESDAAKKSTTTTKKKKAKIKKEQTKPIAKQKEKNGKLKKSNTRKESHKEEEEDVLPFYEIREHYDDQNKEIKSEVINMSDEIKHLKEKVASKSKKKDISENKDDDDGGLAEVSKNVADELEEMMTSMQSTTLNATSATADTMDESPTVQEKDDADDDDAKYNKISARLDELIALEENSEKNKESNLKSSKKLQSKGWNKGFLNKDTKKKKKTKKAVVVAAASSPAASSSSVSEKKAPLASTTKVSFREENEIKEIPRIGTASLPPKNNISGGLKQTKEKKRQPIPIDQHVFTGVVSERPIKQSSSVNTSKDKTSDDGLQNYGMTQNYSMGGMVVGGVGEQPSYGQQKQVAGGNDLHGAEQTQQQQPKKKLSRFAQRRQQQRMS